MPIRCSACILTYNSAKTLEKCLNSVKDFADIVILDGGSTDITLEIAKKYNAVVLPQNEGGTSVITDFTAVRERLFFLAKEDWRLWLDSDEWLDEETVKKIEKIVQGNNQKKLYALKRKAVIGGKIIDYAYFYPEYCKRLFNKNSEVSLKKGKKVHEDLIGPEVEKMDGTIYHAWSEKYGELIKKDNYYLDLTVKGKEKLSLCKKAQIAFINLLKGARVFITSALIYIRRGFKGTLPPSYSWRFMRYHLIYAKKILLLKSPKEYMAAADNGLYPVQDIRCNLCGGKDEQEIFKNEHLRVVMCGNCSLAYINPRMSDSGGYKELYKENYQKNRHGILDYEQAISRLIKKDSYGNALRHLDVLKEYINPDTEVLDIGCGWGALLKAIHDNCSKHVTGIETSELAARAAKEYFGLNIYEERLEDFMNRGFEKKYDVIILKHVFEHFLDPLSMLKNISKLLKDGGAIFFWTPNLAKPDEASDKFFHTEHTYYFSPLTIKEMLRKSGLKILNTNFSRDLITIAVKENDPRRILDTGGLEDRYSRGKILAILKNHNRKYGFLRSCRGILFKFLNAESQARAIRAAKKIFER